MMIGLCAVIFGLYLISLPINMKVRGGIDMEAGSGSLAFTVFGVPVFRAEGLLEIRSLTDSDLIIMHRRSLRRVHISIDRKTLRQTLAKLKALDLSLIANLNVKNVSLKLRYGSDDAFKTTFYLGVFRMFFYSALSALKCSQPVDVSEEFVPEYNMRVLKSEFYGIFSLSIGDIIYGFARGKLKKFKRGFKAWRIKRETAINMKISRMKAAAEAAEEPSPKNMDEDKEKSA